MNPSPGYVLVIGKPNSSIQNAAEAPESVLQSLHCPVVITASLEQAVTKAQEHHPHLVILSGDASEDWSPHIAKEIRQSVQPEGVVIVSLSKSSEFSWMPESSNAEIDGFFVEPLSVDVLSALNQSAMVKKRVYRLHSDRFSLLPAILH